MPGVRALDARPDAVLAASAGGAATSAGAGISPCWGVGAGLAVTCVGVFVCVAGFAGAFSAAGLAALSTEAAGFSAAAASPGFLGVAVGSELFAQLRMKIRDKEIMSAFFMVTETASSARDVQVVLPEAWAIDVLRSSGHPVP